MLLMHGNLAAEVPYMGLSRELDDANTVVVSGGDVDAAEAASGYTVYQILPMGWVS